MKVIIIGAGLGGLSAALRFAMLSHEVIVVEKHASLSPRGGSLSTRPGASRILASWGLGTEMDRIANRTSGIIMRNLKTGHVSSAAPSSNVASGEDQGPADKPPHWGTTREELIQLFYSKAIQYGADVRFGCDVSEVQDDSKHAWVKLEDGTVISADLILAADGIRSRTRAMILQDIIIGQQERQEDPFEPVVSAITGYGFKVKTSDLAALDRAGTARLVENLSSNIWMGAGGVGGDGTSSNNAFAVSRYSAKGAYVAVLCHTIDTDKNTEQESLWDNKGDLGYVRDSFRGCCSEMTRALELAKSCDRWRLAELPRLPRWTSRCGRVVLLGDSAHAMHPSAGQGFSQIVEDVEVLTEIVARSGLATRTDNGMIGENEVPRITKLWQDIRKPRVERIHDYSRWSTEQIQEKVSGISFAADDTAVGEVIRAGEEEFRTREFLEWTLDYDVKKAVDEHGLD